MKILLTAINSKYIHSNLAAYSLKAYAEKEVTFDIAEYTINQHIQKIMADICRRKPDVLFFSCYIWNIKIIEELVQDIAKVMPKTKIWLGGPEVSFDSEKILERIQAISGIIRGEGEETFKRVLEYYTRKRESLHEIEGITFRTDFGKIAVTPDAIPLQLDRLPFPYASLDAFSHRIVYYESSRGCPFRCSYCLSSVDKGLRFRSMEKVKSEILFFMEQNVPQVKFIDRTFNCDRNRTLNIWKFIKEHDNGITNFHFEIAGDLLTEEALELLGSMRVGQVQLEIGVQTTNRVTMSEINRPMDFGKLSEAVKKLRSIGNIHMHLDLIAGLPFEDMNSFKNSFNDVFSLKPHQLQLGFLKVLKGSPMEKNCDKYGLKYTQAPPYEVLETKWISYDELIRLKMIEEMVEVYHNSGRFAHTLELLLPVFDGAFQLFEAIGEWYKGQNLEMLNISRNGRYENLLKFGNDCIKKGQPIDEELLMDALIYDFYMADNIKTRPEFLRESAVDKAFTKAFYSMEAAGHRYLNSERCSESGDPRFLRGMSHLEMIGGKYLVFDYTKKCPMTGNAYVQVITSPM